VNGRFAHDAIQSDDNKENARFSGSDDASEFSGLVAPDNPIRNSMPASPQSLGFAAFDLAVLV